MASIAVLGAGVMGAGVAQDLARAGRNVVLVDTEETALERARSEIPRQLRLQRLFGGGDDAESPDAVLRRITFTTELERCRDAELAIENVPEDWDVKRALYERLDGLAAPACIFASNTSAIPIARIAAVTGRPDRVIGTHFMNPVPMSTTVEVVRGPQTSDDTLARTSALLDELGKQAIVVGDGAGFVTNRVLMLMINEAVRLLEEKRAEARDIDRIFKACAGHKMGPLETADLIGLDTVRATLEVLRESTGDARYAPCSLLASMVDAGLHGRKSGQGFFGYRKGMGSGRGV